MIELMKYTYEKEPIFKNERVLIVDDYEKWLKVATNNLLYYGCEKQNIFRAHNIREGKRIYSTKKSLITITDINFDQNNLEDTQGLEFISEIREINPSGIIVAMSLSIGVRQKTLESGADYFINKGSFTENFDSFVEWYKLGKISKTK